MSITIDANRSYLSGQIPGFTDMSGIYPITRYAYRNVVRIFLEYSTCVYIGVDIKTEILLHYECETAELDISGISPVGYKFHNKNSDICLLTGQYTADDIADIYYSCFPTIPTVHDKCKECSACKNLFSTAIDILVHDILGITRFKNMVKVGYPISTYPGTVSYMPGIIDFRPDAIPDNKCGGNGKYVIDLKN